MKLSFVALALWLSANGGLASTVKPRRTSSLLVRPAGFDELPTASAVRASTASTGLDFDNVQSFVMVGMQKQREALLFFEIKNAKKFKSKLGTDIHGRITSAIQILDVETQPLAGVNIAFSQKGLGVLGIKDDLKDSHFKAGQMKDAASFGDGTKNWVPAFAGPTVHGVFTIASDKQEHVDNEINELFKILGDSVKEVHRVRSKARPGDQLGHEHFGWIDGIAQPVVKGFRPPNPGQAELQPGVILLGQDGDLTKRPAWTKSGSFLVFRQLKQYVPEFRRFLLDQAPVVSGMSQADSANYLGSRMVGRWPSGAPVDLSPHHEDEALGADPKRLNNFTFAHPELGNSFNQATNQTFCPFSAHILKSRPRLAIDAQEDLRHQIARAGLPYGDEVTASEQSTETTSEDPALERGMAFVAYQSSIGDGFVHMQINMVNSPSFPTGRNDPGSDPIVGYLQTDGKTQNTPRPIKGLDFTDWNRTITMKTDFIVSRGGEYFFTPPISALITPLSK
ncbi:dye-decolorizing heme-containing peroxidase [Marasmius tenuissimus]|uniref:Dye-decolorizing heme-containing peroxidase n=1 Tax=Marasmius tenuissimus TaxID=585030 RepID=A0ABR3A9D0_9AGAR|nr:dye-decolorizing heme-containing peroxidase [Marasmius tenuissimus]